MAEFLKDKPSSRVIRPPGGGSSNIFGGPEDRSEPNRAAKPTGTFQSTVFNADPEPAPINKPTNRPSVTSSSIVFAPEAENTVQNSPGKVSKTHQSSIFGDPDDNADKPAELRRPLRRPITAPSYISSCFSSQSVLDVKNPVGQRKKILAGFKPANANLRSTVFSGAKRNALKGRRHFVESTEIVQTLSTETQPPAVEGDSSDAGLEKCGGSKTADKSRLSRTYLSVAFRPPQDGMESPVYSVDGSVLNFSKKDYGNNNGSTVFEPPKIDKPVKLTHVPLPNFMTHTDSSPTVLTTKFRAKTNMHLRRSTIFDQDSDTQQKLWTSGFNMTSCRSRTEVRSDTYRSEVLPCESKVDLASEECDADVRALESTRDG